jgi:hypothetical protein
LRGLGVELLADRAQHRFAPRFIGAPGFDAIRVAPGSFVDRRLLASGFGTHGLLSIGVPTGGRHLLKGGTVALGASGCRSAFIVDARRFSALSVDARRRGAFSVDARRFGALGLPPRCGNAFGFDAPGVFTLGLPARRSLLQGLLLLGCQAFGLDTGGSLGCHEATLGLQAGLLRAFGVLARLGLSQRLGLLGLEPGGQRAGSFQSLGLGPLGGQALRRQPRVQLPGRCGAFGFALCGRSGRGQALEPCLLGCGLGLCQVDARFGSPRTCAGCRARRQRFGGGRRWSGRRRGRRCRYKRRGRR